MSESARYKQVGGRIDPARDGQPNELELGIDSFFPFPSFWPNITPPISTARMPDSL